MFGPNIKSDGRGVCYHHREGRFHHLLQELEETFVKKFQLDDYEFLFLTGSGTMVNETVVFSLVKCDFNILFDDMEFGRRLYKMAIVHGIWPKTSQMRAGTQRCTMYPLYETSISRYNTYTPERDETVFLDMVSAFPYYMPPKGTAIFTTVSGKQLGAYPGIGIIGISRDLDLGEYVCHQDGSCLNLLGHLFHRQQHETLHTPSAFLLRDLLNTIREFDVQFNERVINERRAEIESAVGKENLVGDGPVVTFVCQDWLAPIAQQFNLYRSSHGYQVFLWTGKNYDYHAFCKALKEAVK